MQTKSQASLFASLNNLFPGSLPADLIDLARHRDVAENQLQELVTAAPAETRELFLALLDLQQANARLMLTTLNDLKAEGAFATGN